MDQLRPSQWVVIASGALLFIASFFDVFEDSENAWGNFGTFTWPALLGLAAAGITAAVAFGNVSLPGEILTFSVPQLLVIAGVTSVLIEVGLLLMGFVSDLADPAIGTWLGALGAIGLLVGTVMEQEGGAAAPRSSATPPSPF